MNPNIPEGRATPILRSWLILLTVLGFVPSAAAQRYHADIYTENSGLASSQVNDVLQDPTGRIWFATRGGISRYDGLEWVTYSSAHGLLQPAHAALDLDETGTLWAIASLASHPVSSFQEGTWTPLPPPPWEVERATPVAAFVATQRQGHPLVAYAVDELLVWNGIQWRRFTQNGALPGRVTSLVARQGRLLIGTTGGLAELEGNELTSSFFDAVIRPAIPSVAVQGLAIEEQAAQGVRLWLVGSHWLGFVEDDRFTLLSDRALYPPRNPQDSIVAEPDRHGGLFLRQRERCCPHRPQW